MSDKDISLTIPSSVTTPSAQPAAAATEVAAAPAADDHDLFERPQSFRGRRGGDAEFMAAIEKLNAWNDQNQVLRLKI